MLIDCVILGSGGHGKVVLDAFLISSHACRVMDHDPDRVGSTLLGIKVELFDLDHIPSKMHLAIGDNAVRKKLHQELDAFVSEWVVVRHPDSVVSASAGIGDGVFIAANSIVGADSKIGMMAIVNHGSVVDHDCIVGAYCHVAPNATLGGGVRLANGVLVGSGAVILPGIDVGENAVIGSGAVVTRNVSSGSTVLGVPAKEKSR